MATITIRQQDSYVDFSSTETFTYTGEDLIQTDSAYGWGWIDFYGTGFSFNGDGEPTDGTVTSFGYGHGKGNALKDHQLQIAGLNFQLNELISLVQGNLSSDDQQALILNTVLKGNDRINIGSNATAKDLYVIFSGDGRNTTSDSVIHSGNDSIAGDAGGSGFIAGDFYLVKDGATVYGGNDHIKLTHESSGQYGDVHFLAGTLFGGNDVLSGSGGPIIGDASSVYDTARLHGGNDRITLTRSGAATGDASFVEGASVGGNDIIVGSKQDDRLCGDFGEVDTSAGSVQCGADRIHGGDGDDIIRGDWYEIWKGVKASGGNDKLYGNGGNDTIYGDIGADLIDGGKGNDILTGGRGFDTFIFGKGYGNDKIMDFDADGGDGHQDHIAAGYKSVLGISKVGKHDTLIDFGGGDTITLLHVKPSHLDAMDFV